MAWEDLSKAEQRQVHHLNLWYERLFRHLDGSWDLPTLYMCHPGVYNSLKRLNELARPLRAKLKD